MGYLRRQARRDRQDVTYDVGGLYYFYPSNKLHPSANTFELYGQIGRPVLAQILAIDHQPVRLCRQQKQGYLDGSANQELATAWS
jgi:hypothetical protein